MRTPASVALRPQSNRMTPAKARGRMLLLVRDMAATTSSFNAHVLGLREQKRALVARLNAMRARLTAVNQQLGVPGGPAALWSCHASNTASAACTTVTVRCCCVCRRAAAARHAAR